MLNNTSNTTNIENTTNNFLELLAAPALLTAKGPEVCTTQRVESGNEPWRRRRFKQW